MATTGARVLQLLSRLGSGAVVGADALADALKVTERTVRRDVATLRELGYEVDVVRGVGGGYRLRAGARLPPLLFDDDQVVAIAVALQTATSVLTGIEQSSARALATVRQVMPDRLRIESDAFAVTSVPNYWNFPAAPIDATVVREIGAAVRARHVLRADYDAVGGEPQRVRVEPHRVVVWAARWYLVAYDLDRDAWRVLRLDRLTAKDPTYTPFADRTVPGGDAEAFVKRTFDRGDSPAAWPCQGSAVLDVPPDVVAEFAPGGAVVERVDDATTRLRMGAWSWVGLAGLFITFAADMRDVQPAELRRAFASVGDRVARMPLDPRRPQ